MLGEPLTYEESCERVYCSYPDRYLKRSLAPSEYKGPFGFEGYINTGIDILNFNSRVFEYRYLNTRRP